MRQTIDNVHSICKSHHVPASTHTRTHARWKCMMPISVWNHKWGIDFTNKDSNFWKMKIVRMAILKNRTKQNTCSDRIGKCSDRDTYSLGQPLALGWPGDEARRYVCDEACSALTNQGSRGSEQGDQGRGTVAGHPNCVTGRMTWSQRSCSVRVGMREGVA